MRTRPHFLTHSGLLKIEHTETDTVDPRSNGRPSTAAAVPKSAVSALKSWEGPLTDSASKPSVPLVLQKGEPVPDPMGAGRELVSLEGCPRLPGLCPLCCPTGPGVPPIHEG